MSYGYRRSLTFDKKFKKLAEKDQVLKNKFVNKISQFLDNPEIGDFKRYDLKDVQGVNVNPFVILYQGYGWLLKQKAPGGGLRLRDEVEGKDAAHGLAVCYREDAGGDEKKSNGEVVNHRDLVVNLYFTSI
jgi:mRNA-degrading endonuclease RelE of RelBE toxin-antitoxin system